MPITLRAIRKKVFLATLNSAPVFFISRLKAVNFETPTPRKSENTAIFCFLNISVNSSTILDFFSRVNGIKNNRFGPAKNTKNQQKSDCFVSSAGLSVRLSRRPILITLRKSGSLILYLRLCRRQNRDCLRKLFILV